MAEKDNLIPLMALALGGAGLFLLLKRKEEEEPIPPPLPPPPKEHLFESLSIWYEGKPGEKGFPKSPGEGVMLYLTFSHKGPAGEIALDWEIAPGSVIPGVYYWDRGNFALKKLRIALGEDKDWRGYELLGLYSTFPDLKDKEDLLWPFYDSRVTIYLGAKKVLGSEVDDDVFKRV